jgi:hypothetical protein
MLVPGPPARGGLHDLRPSPTRQCLADTVKLGYSNYSLEPVSRLAHECVNRCGRSSAAGPLPTSKVFKVVYQILSVVSFPHSLKQPQSQL